VNYICHSFRNAETIFNNDNRYTYLWDELKSTIEGITDEEIIEHFSANPSSSMKSISDAINKLIDSRLHNLGWNRQSPIFNNPDYISGNVWSLDFAKDEISIEVAFNHSGAIAWNLIKPVLASELNHVEKAIQTSAGVIITATDAMREAGNFDSAIGTYEKYLKYLIPLRNMLTVPIMLIGIVPPDSFRINSDTRSVEMIN